jgi:hypothetical protein
MKLVEVADKHLTGIDRPLIGRFAPGINFIYGERGAGKTRLWNFLSGFLFGQHPAGSLISDSGPWRWSDRCLRLSDGRGEFLLTRSSSNPGQAEIRDLQRSETWSHRVSQTIDILSNPVQNEARRGLFALIYAIDSSQVSACLPKLGNLLQTYFSVPLGPAASGGEDGAFQVWKLESERRTLRLSELQQLLDPLRLKRARLVEQLEAQSQADRVRLVQLERELLSLEAQLSAGELATKRSRLQDLDHQISLLKQEIGQLIVREHRQPQVCRVSGHLELSTILYSRLDEIDFQIESWSRIQAVIQSRRFQLKQEMQAWNELNLKSPGHPYHAAQKLLTSIESRVNHADQQARHWELTPVQQTDPTPAVRNIQTLCQSMREDLNNLGQELGSQYKHLRHRAAALELKHLRESYEMTSQNLTRLAELRQQAIHELQRFDASGAESILKREAGWVELARQHGHLQARRQLLGPWPRTDRELPVSDLNEFYQRLETLENERNLVARWITEQESGRVQGQLRQRQLQDERQQIQQRLGMLDSAELTQLDLQLNQLATEQELLKGQLAEGREFARTPVHPLLARANQLLQVASRGNWVRLWLVAESPLDAIMVCDSTGKAIPAAGLSPVQQNLVYLALAMAAKESLRESGLDLPCLLDDAFANFSRDNVPQMIRLLDELQKSGHQILLFTNHQYLADRLPGSPVFELPLQGRAAEASIGEVEVIRREPATSPNAWSPSPIVDLQVFAAGPVVTPAVYVAQSPGSDQWMTEVETMAGPGLAAPSLAVRNAHPHYPLSKYPAVNEIPDSRDFIVAYPGPRDGLTDRQDDPSELRIEGDRRERASVRGTPRVTPVSVESVGDALGFAPTVDGLTRLESLEIFQLEELRRLGELELNTVQQLLAVDPEELSSEIRGQGFTADQINRWQSIVWLLCNVPGMRPEDARILVACGVTEPEHLATSHSQQLLERLERYLSTTRGPRHIQQAATRISLAKVNGWQKALQSTRSRWQKTGQLSRLELRTNRMDRPRTETPFDTRDPQTGMTGTSPAAGSRNLRAPVELRPPRMQTPDQAMRTSRLNVTEKSPVRSAPTEPTGEGEKNRFYLNLKDHVEAAPSIGPKTAERFEKIGISTVAEFLKQTSESMASKLKYRRITADLIATWQDQTRLVCQIPNLRGHDAQLLVACGFTEPEQIAAMHPQKLLDIVLPFSRTKEGLKIIRTGKEPDLQEMKDWIRWASMNRSLHAA